MPARDTLFTKSLRNANASRAGSNDTCIRPSSAPPARMSVVDPALPVPGPGVSGVLDREGGLAEIQRPECVNHDGQLVEELGADRPFHRTRLGAVREAGRVQRDRPLLDARAPAGLVIAAGV